MNFSNINEIPKISIPNFDKIVHFTLYTILSFLWMWSLKTKANHSFKKNASFIFLIGTCFGIVIEILQETLTQTRSGEILDVLSNSSGILFGLLISKIVLK